MTRLYYWIIAICAIYATPVFAERLLLASTHWCPYVCESEQAPGFIAEYMADLLKRDGIELEVKVLPWARAVNEAREGRYQGVLTAVQAESPGFPLTKIPNGDYQLCFYRSTHSDFHYDNRESLANIVVGAIKGYGYDDPIASMKVSPRVDEKLLEISSETPLLALIQMLKANRIGTLIEDKAVMEYTLKQMHIKGVEEAGCQPAKPFYLALSPSFQDKALMMQRIEKLLAQPEAIELRQYYRNNYR